MSLSWVRMAHVQLGLLHVTHASTRVRAHEVKGIRGVYSRKQQGAAGLRFHHSTQSATFNAK